MKFEILCEYEHAPNVHVLEYADNALRALSQGWDTICNVSRPEDGEFRITIRHVPDDYMEQGL